MVLAMVFPFLSLIVTDAITAEELAPFLDLMVPSASKMMNGSDLNRSSGLLV